MGGYDHSQIGKSQCCLSVCRSVGRSVGQSIGKQSVRRKERNVFPVGRDDEKEESRRLDIYRKMPRH